jgi:hypothetical protein
MKSKLQKICKLTDELQEAIELLSDIHEELYKSVFEDNCL